jgi:3-(3-hydroxy-phenyl)propionate hydroxylase
LNSGLRDAQNLSWKLSMVLQGLATPQLLDTYHQERYRHVAQMIRLSSFLGSIVMSTALPVAFCRNIILHMLNTVPAVRKFLAEAGLKPQPRYKTGFLLSDGSNKAITGALLPQPEVTTLQGQRVLLDEILGPGFTVLRLHNNPEEAFAAIKANFWERLGVHCVCVQPESMNSERQDCYKEQPASTGANSLPFTIVKSNDINFLSSLQDQFIVIRPDRYVLGVFKEKNAAMFVSAFQRLLQHQFKL